MKAAFEDLESPYLRGEVALAEPRLEFDQPQKGNAIPRGKAADELGTKILDLLWEPIVETDVPRMADRLRRLEVVLDKVSNADACTLLPRLLPKGDLYPDFRYRLSTASRQRLRRKLRQRCEVPPPPRQRLTPPPPPPPPRRVPPPPPPIRVDPEPVPPTKTPTPPSRKWHPVGVYVFKTKDRRLKRFGKWGIFYRLEVEVTGSVNATDKEILEIKAQWENGEFKPEVETKFGSKYVPDIKIQRDLTWNVALKKEFKVLDKKMNVSPHLQFRRDEPIAIEFEFGPFFKDNKYTLLKQEFQISVMVKVVASLRIDWLQVLVEPFIRGIRGWIEGLWREFLAFFGKRVLGKLGLRLIIASLLGAVVAWIFFSEDDEPIEIEPPDIDGWDPALEHAAGGGSRTAEGALKEAATMYRRAFAKGFGDTLTELTRGAWPQRLDELMKPQQIHTFKNLPGPNAAPRDWVAWTGWSAEQAWEYVNLSSDGFVVRFRRAEKALMFAVAQHHRRNVRGKPANVLQTASAQATIAGMAAAVQHVRRTITRDTYDFLDEQGKPEHRDGLQAWAGIAQIVRKSGIKEVDIQRRLGHLGVELLPVHKQEAP